MGLAKSTGSHVSNPKPTIIVVVNPDTSRAMGPVRRAIAARAKKTVVAIAQNICPGGIHFGTRLAFQTDKKAAPEWKRQHK
jgi:hypothetical protein